MILRPTNYPVMEILPERVVLTVQVIDNSASTQAYLLKEDGAFLLKEDGFRIIL